jgi:hypothetical protein
MVALLLKAGVISISVWAVTWLSTKLYAKNFALGETEGNPKPPSLSGGGGPSQKSLLTNRIDLII